MTVSGSGYSLFGSDSTTRSGDGKTKTERQRAYAYMRKHLLMFDAEVSRTKQRLEYFAEQSDLELAAVFIEEIQTYPAAFERFLQAVIQDDVKVVLLPSLLHFAVLGSPNHIKEFFEAATGAKVLSALDVVTYRAGEAVS
ncbi:hypothetical protein AB0E63_44800 [Kribbella sp. NPDC026596]|uniref:hypothetical protein n=1 Tax=Kribbella sp. NPDC026596 TaxID=3155122 RepID=UPI0033E55302